MKKIFNVLSCMFLLIANATISVKAENVGDLQSAIQVADYFRTQSGWDDYEIIRSSPISDLDLNEYGYVFEITNTVVDGYIIVVENQSTYEVVEASRECAFPYENYDATSYNYVYVGAMNYYVSPISDADELFGSFISVRTSDVVSREEFETTRYISEGSPIQGRINPTRTDKYIANYSAYFETVVQGEGNGCIPWSMAMALKYLHNRGKFTLSMTNVGTIGRTLYNLMGGSPGVSYSISPTNAATGLSAFGNTYCNKTLSTRTDGFWPVSFSSVKAEIDSNYPVVLMFRGGTMYSSNHATTMVGYSIINNGGSIAEYVVVRDPGANTVPERIMAWNSTNIYGYFIIYVS